MSAEEPVATLQKLTSMSRGYRRYCQSTEEETTTNRHLNERFCVVRDAGRMTTVQLSIWIAKELGWIEKNLTDAGVLDPTGYNAGKGVMVAVGVSSPGYDGPSRNSISPGLARKIALALEIVAASVTYRLAREMAGADLEIRFAPRTHVPSESVPEES